MMNILKSNGNADSIQYHIGNVSTKRETTRKNQMEMLEMKNVEMEMKNPL